MATQSLPSFAQAFSSPSLSNISTGSKLPPIQSQNVSARPASTPPRKESPRPLTSDSPIGAVNSRKRPRTGIPEGDPRDSESSGSDVLRSTRNRVKPEQDQDALEATPPPAKLARFTESDDTRSSNIPPSPIPHRRRRSTISGSPHPLITDTRQAPSEPANSSPISPVAMGVTSRDDAAALEQARSAISAKQNQHALNEQQRGSHVGSAGAVYMGGDGEASTSPIPSSAALAEGQGAHKSASNSRQTRRSPNAVSSPAGLRRGLSNSSTHGSIMSTNPQPPSPSPLIVPSQAPQASANQSTAALSALAAPPISFGRRRAGQLGQGKKKPADIVISPREAHTTEQFQPAIQSAPPIPQGNQGQFYSGRFPMTIPRLPSVMSSGESLRRVSKAQVPPTPTRFTMFRNFSTNNPNSNTHGHLVPPPPSIRRSPPASVPVATTLVPPTPSSLHQPGYTGDKSAFLAPFDTFYEALNDSKQLKNWLAEQLQRSNNLIQTLTQQQERTLDMVETVVEKRVCGMRNEIQSLRRRIEDLEATLRLARTDGGARRPSIGSVSDISKGKQPTRNGALLMPSDTYKFPPGEPMRTRQEPVPRVSSPVWRSEREREVQGSHDSDGNSPAPFDAHKRMSISATRLDPLPQQESSPKPRPSFVVQSQPHMYREGSGVGLHPLPGATHSKTSSSGSSSAVRATFAHSTERVGQLHRQGSHSRSPSKSHHPHASDGGEAKPADDGRSPKVSHSRTSSIAAPLPSPPGSAMDER